MNDCVFCKIAAGDIPAHKVYEDDQVVAFLDIDHFTVGHTLIIPKTHYANILETPDDLLAKIAVLGKDLANNYKPILGFERATFLVVGEDIDHFHYQLIPRYKDHKFKLAVQHKEKKVDLEKLANDLRGE